MTPAPTFRHGFCDHRPERADSQGIVGKAAVGRIIGAVVAAAVSVALSLAMTPLARAERMIFDPTLCATDPQGNVTIALGRIVLQVPIHELSYILDLPADDRAAAPVPPDPSQPEGCPDHPIVGKSFSFNYLVDAFRRRDRSDGALPRRIDRLLLVDVPRDYWGRQPSNENRFDGFCSTNELRRTASNGLTICGVQPADQEIPREHWPFAAQAPIEIYGAPFHRPYTVSCLWGFVRGTHQCDVVYKLYETVNLSYRFAPHRLPIEDLIDLDRELRAWIESSRVLDFVWPDEEVDTDGLER